MNKIIMLIITSFLVVFLTACGGGSDSTPTTTSTTSTGKVIDNEVGNLIYECYPSLKFGTTDAQGDFSCDTGDTVSFFIKSMKIAELDTADFVTLSMMFPGSETSVINSARFFQTVDEDKNASNGIFIDNDLAIRFVAANIPFDSVNFEALAQQVLGVTLIPAIQAIEHYNETLVKYGFEPEVFNSLIPVVDDKPLIHTISLASSLKTNETLTGSITLSDEDGLSNTNIKIEVQNVDDANNTVYTGEMVDNGTNGVYVISINLSANSIPAGNYALTAVVSPVEGGSNPQGDVTIFHSFTVTTPDPVVVPPTPQETCEAGGGFWDGTECFN